MAPSSPSADHRVQPVKVTSGAGFLFEDQVGAFLAASLLARSELLGSDLGRLCRIEFQVAVDGWKFDDLLVTFQPSGGRVRWSVSVKGMPYVERTMPAEFVRHAWEELTGSTTSDFNVDVDCLGLITGSLPSSVRSDIEELMKMARSQGPEQLDQRVDTAGYVSEGRRALWESMRCPDDLSDAEGVSSSPGELLGRLRRLDLDFGESISFAEQRALELCRSVLLDPSEASDLWGELLRITAETRTSGGCFDEDRLLSRLGSRFHLKREASDEAVYLGRLMSDSRSRLIERWRAAGVDEQAAVDLADDRSVGMLTDPIPSNGVVVIVGDFGAGKSVAAERIHQTDVLARLNDERSRLPVYTKARSVDPDFEKTVIFRQGTAHSVARLATGQVSLVIDGLDEAGFSRGRELLDAARVFVRTRPGTRVVITTRRGFAVRDEERVDMRPLTDQQLDELATRLTGREARFYGLPAPVRDAARWPLFAIILLLRNTVGSSLPQSRAWMIDAMVRRALNRSWDDVAKEAQVLAFAASKSVAGSGWFSTEDVGGLDVEARLLESRLVVRADGGLRFSLPIIEQYFAARALLGGAVEIERVLGALDRFEPWRYAFVVAIGIGTWEQTSDLLERLSASFPGAACWVVKEALRSHSARDAPAEGGPHLPDSLECADQFHRAMESWVSAFEPYISLSPLTRDGELQAIHAHSRENWVTLALVNVAAGEPRFDVLDRPTSIVDPDPSVLTWRGGKPPAIERAWPWKWSVDWVGEAVENLLRGQKLDHGDLEVLAFERQWALVRALTADTSTLHRPIAAAHVARAAQLVLGQVQGGTHAVVKFHGSDPVYEVSELEAIATEAASRKNAYTRPWPCPDFAYRASGWISDMYSDDLLVETLERVYTAALEAYEWLLVNRFPKWRPTMGWGAAIPIRLDLTLIPAPAGQERSLFINEVPLPSDEHSHVTVRRADRADEAVRWSSEHEDRSQRERLLSLRPTTAAWARIGQWHGHINVFGDTPATDLAYRWIWRDLHALGLLTKHPPL